MVHLVGDGFGCGVVGKAVEVDGGEAGVFGSEDVGVEVVAYHDGAFLGGVGDGEGVGEELGGGFVGSGVFAEDDGVEVVDEAAGAEFLVLHFVESVAAHVHAVAFRSEVVHQFAGSIDKTGLDGAELEEAVAGLEAIIDGGIQSFAEAEWMAEPLHDEVVARDFAFGILCPEADVGGPVVGVEDLGIGEVAVEPQFFEEFAQGDDGIAVGVVERVVEVDEEVGVVHLLEDCCEALVGGSGIGVDVATSGFACLAQGFGVADELVHDGGE